MRSHNSEARRLEYLSELADKMDEIRLWPRVKLLERFYGLSVQEGFTHEEGVEFDALRIVLKADNIDETEVTK